MNKKDVITHTHTEILLSHEKGGYPAVCDNMNGPWACYAKWDKTDQDKYCKISIICGI